MGQTSTFESLGSKAVNLYVPGTVVLITGIRYYSDNTLYTPATWVIQRVSVDWTESGGLDEMDNFVQTLSILAIDDKGKDLGLPLLTVNTDMYDIVIV